MDTIDDPSLVDDSEMPSFIKQASSETNIEKLSSKDFALVLVTRAEKTVPKYPINDPANTWRSQNAFCKTAHLLRPIERVTAAKHIKKACDKYFIDTESVIEKLSSVTFWGNETNTVKFDDGWIRPDIGFPKEVIVLIADDMEKAAKAYAEELHRNKLSPDNYGLVINGENKYPLFNEGHVKQACSYFEDHYLEFEPRQRREFATNVASKCSKYRFEVPDSIAKYAGRDYSPALEFNIQARKDLLSDENEIELYDLMLEKKASLRPDQFAYALSQLDAKINMDQYWDDKVLDPYASTLCKKADRLEHYVFDMGDVVINGLDLGKLAENPDVLAGYLAPEIVAMFQKKPITVFESLPRPQKMIITRAIQGKLSNRANAQQPASQKSEIDEIARGEASPKDISLGTGHLVDDYAASKEAAQDLALLSEAKKKIIRSNSDTSMGGDLPGKVKFPSTGLIDTHSTYVNQYPSKMASTVIPDYAIKNSLKYKETLRKGYEKVKAMRAARKAAKGLKKVAKIVEDAKMPTGPSKSLLGSKAVEQVIPDGPKSMGVQTPKSRLVDSKSKTAGLRDTVVNFVGTLDNLNPVFTGSVSKGVGYRKAFKNIVKKRKAKKFFKKR